MSYSLVFWEPVPSPHTAALHAALRRHPEIGSVFVNCVDGMPDDRRAMGWSLPNGERLPDVVGVTAEEIRRSIQACDRNAIHIFSGTRNRPAISVGIRHCIESGRRFGIMSEPRDGMGLTGAVRRLHSLMCDRDVARRASFVLAIGCNGRSWFESVGFSSDRIYDFAYFIEEPTGDPLLVFPFPGYDENILCVGYVGRLTREKGFDIFLELAQGLEPSIKVVVIGDGPLRPKIERLIHHRPNTFYMGVLPMAEVRRHYQTIDVLCVPSRKKDGWAVVVSEALMAGSAVLATEHVGASGCLEADPRLGRRIQHLSTKAFKNELMCLVQVDDMAQDRAYRACWARTHLSATAGAKRVVEVLNSVIHSRLPPEPLFV